MPRLTLNVDKTVLARAKRYAKKRGVSVSQIVQEYLDIVSVTPTQAAFSPAKSPANNDGPVLRSLRGILKSANIEIYRDHLVAKYR
jgi:hypothetical protein